MRNYVTVYENIFKLKFNWKTFSLLVFLVIFPNILGMFNINLFGIRIHFFQYLIFLAAMLYGPLVGALSGAFGSIWTALALNNPYIIIGNIILGLFTGLFFKKKLNIMLAVLLAYLIQLPWLWF